MQIRCALLCLDLPNSKKNLRNRIYCISESLTSGVSPTLQAKLLCFLYLWYVQSFFTICVSHMAHRTNPLESSMPIQISKWSMNFLTAANSVLHLWHLRYPCSLRSCVKVFWTMPRSCKSYIVHGRQILLNSHISGYTIGKSPCFQAKLLWSSRLCAHQSRIWIVSLQIMQVVSPSSLLLSGLNFISNIEIKI